MSDAEQTPSPEPTDAPIGTPQAEPAGYGLGTLLERFVLAYPLVFMLPFPLTVLGLLNSIPGFGDSLPGTVTGWLIGLHAQATQPIIAWMGQWLVGEQPSFEFTGSGDGLANYLGVWLDLVIALVISISWWLWRRSTPVSPRVADACRVLLRYFLIWVMFSYGFSKVFPLQFPAMGPDRLLQPYGDSSPMGLLWTFMGASAGYQMFGGAAEVLGGVLLLFRRTTTLGALVVAGVMTNVFAMNLFFDVPVKLYSFHYLLLALFLVIPDLSRLFGVLIANTPVGVRDLRPFWHGSRRRHYAFVIAKLVLVISLLGTTIDSRVERMKTRGLWAPPNELRGVYRVESFELEAPQDAALAEHATAPENVIGPEGSAPEDAMVTGSGPRPGIPDEIRWVRVGINPPWSATVQRADGLSVRMRMRLDEEASTIALYDRSQLEPSSDPLTLERLGDGQLRLSGLFGDQPVVVTLRLDETESLFTSRHFRWINEYPFNR